MGSFALTDAKYLDDDSEEGVAPLLSSRHAVEQLEGMKRLIALMSIGRDVSRFFPSVVNLIASNSFGVKKLAYIYLVRYAESCPDEALLSINSFQKDLKDSSPVVRTLSLRVMSSIRVPITVPLVVMAIQKCSQDQSPVVRTAAALAIPKVLCNDRDQGQLLEEVVGALLQDSSPSVLGCAVAAFLEICPDRTNLLHAHFLKLCGILPELNEWGQASVLRLLLMYGRGQLTRPEGAGPVLGGGGGGGGGGGLGGGAEVERERRVLVGSAAPLLRSRNAGVVVAAASVLLHLGDEASDGKRAAAALVHLLRTSPKGCGQIVLANIAAVSAGHPWIFRPYMGAFFVTEADRPDVRELKVRILASLVDESTIKGLLREFQAYIRQGDGSLVCQTIRALGRCAAAVPQIAGPCVKTLLSLAFHDSDAVSAESMSVMRALVQHQPDMHAKSVAKLLRRLPELKSPEARATAVWMAGMDVQVAAEAGEAGRCGEVLVGGVHGLDGACLSVLRDLSPEVIRLMAGNFHAEEECTKLQVLGTSAKLMLLFPERMGPLHAHVLQLGLLDPALDVRDKARLLQGLGGAGVGTAAFPGMLSAVPTSAAEAVQEDRGSAAAAAAAEERDGAVVPLHTLSRDLLMCRKRDLAASAAPSPPQPPRWAVGSLSLVVEHAVPGYVPIPDFPEALPDAARRTYAPPAAAAALPAAVAPPATVSAPSPRDVAVGVKDMQLADRGFYSSDGSGSGSGSSGSGSGSDEDDL